MINMKSLEKAVDRATRSGITLMVSGGNWYFLSGLWAAITTIDNLREYGREVLGLVVEMMGDIPAAGTWSIVKSKGAYLVQTEIEDTATALLATYAGASGPEVRAAGLWYAGGWLWQGEDRWLYGVSEGGPAWDGNETRIVNDAMCLVVEHGGDALYKRVKRPTDDWDEQARELWKWLEGRTWADWEATV